jgi:hypothetical protein
VPKNGYNQFGLRFNTIRALYIHNVAKSLGLDLYRKVNIELRICCLARDSKSVGFLRRTNDNLDLVMHLTKSIK